MTVGRSEKEMWSVSRKLSLVKSAKEIPQYLSVRYMNINLVVSVDNNLEAGKEI